MDRRGSDIGQEVSYCLTSSPLCDDLSVKSSGDFLALNVYTKLCAKCLQLHAVLSWHELVSTSLKDQNPESLLSV